MVAVTPRASRLVPDRSSNQQAVQSLTLFELSGVTLPAGTCRMRWEARAPAVGKLVPGIATIMRGPPLPAAGRD